METQAQVPDYMQIVAHLPPLPAHTPLSERFYGKRVAIVGNAPLSNEDREKITACDEVVRFNNIYNLGGSSGEKTTILCLTPSTCWATKNDVEKRLAYLRGLNPRPLILLCKMPERWRWKSVVEAFNDFPFGYDDVGAELGTLTTGTALLAHVAETCDNCEVHVFGFDFDAEHVRYLNADGQHYVKAGATGRELSTLSRAVEICAGKRIMNAQAFTDYRVIIPARAGSKGVPNKNILDFGGEPLLVKKVREACGIFGRERVVALVDSEEYANILAAHGFGDCVPYIDKEREDLEDITLALRRWRDFSEFYGNILLLQTTSASASSELLSQFKNRAEKYFDSERCYISVAPLEYKSSAILLASGAGETVRQMFRGAPAMTVPRQVIPKAYRFTGAATLFNAENVSRNSLFDGLTLMPILSDKIEDAVDIDSEKDLTAAKILCNVRD